MGWFFLWDLLFDSRDMKKESLDPIGTLSAVSSNTSKMKIGLILTPITSRRPWKLARELIPIDHLSKGRLIAEIGLGFNKEKFSKFNDDEDLKIRTKKSQIKDLLDVPQNMRECILKWITLDQHSQKMDLN